MAHPAEPGPPRDPRKARLLRLYQALLEAFGPRDECPPGTVFERAVRAILASGRARPGAVRATERLDRAGLLSPARLAAVAPGTLVRMLRPAGIGRRKAGGLLAFSRWLVTRAAGTSAPLRTEPLAVLRRDLLEVSGLGPETVDTVLLHAAHRPVFVADASARRVLRRHRLLAGSASYEEARLLLEAHLPSDPVLFARFQALLLTAARSHCRTRPRCQDCPLRFDLAGRRPAA